MTWQNTFHCKGLSIPGSPCTSAVRIGGHVSSLLGDQNGKVGIKLMLGTGIFSIRPPNKSEKDKRGYGALRDVKWGTGLLCDRHSHIEFAREHTGAGMQARLAQHWLSHVQPTPTEILEEVWASIGAAGRTALETSDASGVLTMHQAKNHAHLKQREGSVPANSADGVMKSL